MSAEPFRLFACQESVQLNAALSELRVHDHRNSRLNAARNFLMIHHLAVPSGKIWNL